MPFFSLDQSKRFLDALGSKLPGDGKFTFQMFGDGKHRKKVKQHRKILHGTLEEHAEQLKKLNQAGAGIFVTVNLTDGQGREEENIIGLRAAIIDSDKEDLLEIFKRDPDIDNCYPNIIVKTKRGHHAYWLLDRWESREEFTPLQVALIEKFGTDHEVRDLARVMRLPGFFHMKDEPTLVCSRDVFEKAIEEGRATKTTLEHVDAFCDVSGQEKDGAQRDGDRRGYKIPRLVELLNLTIPDLTPEWKKQGFKPTPSRSTDFPLDFRLYLAENYLHRIDPPTQGSGDAHETVGSACRVGHDFDVDIESYWPILNAWGRRCNPPFIESDLRYEYETFLKATKYPPGTKLYDSEYNREAQYRNWLRAQGFDVSAAGEVYRDNDEVPWSDNPDKASRFIRADKEFSDEAPNIPFPPDLPPESNLLNENLDPIDEYMLDGEKDRVKRAIGKKEQDKKRRAKEREELEAKGPAYLVWPDHGEPPDLHMTKDGRYKVKPSYHREIAWHYLTKICQTEDYLRILHFHNEEFAEWDGTSYRAYKSKVYRKKVANFLARCAEETSGIDASDETVFIPYKVNIPRKKELIEALQDMAHLDTEYEAPCWLIDQGGMPDPREVIVCKNGLLDIRNRKLLDNTPAFFSSNYIAVNYDPDAPKPTRWLKFLDEVFPNDEESKRLLKWWFGYCMTEDTRQQKILMMVGRPRSGKGTCMHMLKMLVGKRAYGSMNFKALGGTFGLESAVNKSVLVFSDSRVGPKTDQAAIVESLLGISGEDVQHVARKNISSLDIQLKCRIILVSNEVLNLHDTSGALGTRILMIRFTEEFKDDISDEQNLKIQDKKLKDKLEIELPGILNWSIEGWDELQKSGRFFQPESSADFISTFSAQSSPTNEFVEQCCEISKGFEIETKDLFECWKVWCIEQGYKQGNQASLGKNLMSVIAHLRRVRTPKDINAKRPWCYRGMKLNEVWEGVMKKQQMEFENFGKDTRMSN